MDGSANYSGVSDGDSHSICKFNLLLLSTPTRCPERIKTNKSVLKDRFHTSFTQNSTDNCYAKPAFPFLSLNSTSSVFWGRRGLHEGTYASGQYCGMHCEPGYRFCRYWCLHRNWCLPYVWCGRCSRLIDY